MVPSPGTDREPKDVVEALQLAALDDRRGIRFIEGDRDEHFVSYATLLDDASRMLSALQAAGVERGDEVVLQYDSPRLFLTGFWASLLGGFIAVPLAVGTSADRRQKLANVLARLTKPTILTTTDEALDGATERTLRIDAVPEGIAAVPVERDAGDLAFIQFSSGSTGTPKGVSVTHRSLIANISDLARQSRYRTDDVSLTWMPLTHDMGLIGAHLTAVLCAIDQCIMPPSLFIRRPALWMKKAAEHRATVLFSPNFGLHYFIGAYRADVAAAWDLSHVRMIYNGAEPISVALIHRFNATLAPHGLSPLAMSPCYGLAEATLAATISAPDDELVVRRCSRAAIGAGRIDVAASDAEDAIEIVGTGTPLDSISLRIVDDALLPVGACTIGRIQIRGTSVTRCYYNDA